MTVHQGNGHYWCASLRVSRRAAVLRSGARTGVASPTPCVISASQVVAVGPAGCSLMSQCTEDDPVATITLPELPAPEDALPRRDRARHVSAIRTLRGSGGGGGGGSLLISAEESVPAERAAAWVRGVFSSNMPSPDRVLVLSSMPVSVSHQSRWHTWSHAASCSRGVANTCDWGQDGCRQSYASRYEGTRVQRPRRPVGGRPALRGIDDSSGIGSAASKWRRKFPRRSRARTAAAVWHAGVRTPGRDPEPLPGAPAALALEHLTAEAAQGRANCSLNIQLGLLLYRSDLLSDSHRRNQMLLLGAAGAGEGGHAAVGRADGAAAGRGLPAGLRRGNCSLPF